MPDKSRYGYFDNKAREFIITRPDTPIPWINYLGCQDYLGIISNTAGGYSFYRDARLRRLTRYHYNAIPKDNPGRYIYVCDGKKTWNPGFKPVKTKLDDYKCRHGLGYTVIEGALDGLRIDPCIPPEWSGFTITRKFRGVTYNIKVLNPDKVMKGVKKMLVNGKPQPGNVVGLFKKGSVVKVEVYLGIR